MAEKEGEVDFLVGEEFEGGADEVGVAFGGDAEFGTEASVVVTSELFGVGFESIFGEGFGFIKILGLREGEKGFGETAEVPESDVGLVAPGIAGVAIDGAEDALGMKLFHESAGAVVDGFA